MCYVALVPVALSVAVLSVALGVAVGLAGRLRGRAIAPLQTFALVAAVTIVLAQLLPDALTTLGPVALLVFAASLALPTIAEKALHRVRNVGEHAGHRVGLELGYLGLLFHKVGDGLGLGLFSSEAHAGHHHADVLVAIGAHTVPVVALVVLAYLQHGGLRVALARGAGLAAAAVVGVLVAHTVPVAAVASFEPWVSAAVSGLLLHVVFHDWHPSGPATPGTRAAELVAVAAGVGLILLGGDHHHHGHGGEDHDLRDAVARALVELTLDTAPALLLGLLAAAALAALVERRPVRWRDGGSRSTHALAGVIAGAGRAVDARSALSGARALRERGAPAALVVAFLLAGPGLGVETFAVTGRLLGWPFASARWIAAAVIAVLAAWLVARGRRAPRAPERSGGGAAGGSFSARWVGALDELVHRVAPWTIVGVLAAAYVAAATPAGALDGLGTGAGALVAITVALPSQVCAPSATMLAAVLLGKGLSPGAALAGLLLGPAVHLSAIAFLSGAYGRRATGVALLVVLAATVAAAFALDLSGVTPPTLELHGEASAGWPSIAMTAALALLVARGIYRRGLRAWLGSSMEAHGEHGHGHGHGHGHD